MDKRFFKKLSGFLAIAAAALIAAACSSPVGTINGSGSNGSRSGDDALWAVPNRIIYDIGGNGNGNGNSAFNRSTDLQIFLSDKGVIEIVPVRDAEINIIENPGRTPENKRPVTNTVYYFQSSGRKQVEINYNGMTTRYSVEVEGLSFNDDSGSLEIIWL